VSVSIYMYTDDNRKNAYLDVHAKWIDASFDVQHAALAI